ncbi:60S ribosomal export protein NMD3 [Grifola frondosa]|uniref:60S ribosomal export protein NMD3 n=1 Tax=Grifola frondosa TaxID=5627 RepID=A0A1C7LLD2_GRIFR|nr:60S ribosomal export protein NMD3 [Grifola frondosa]
MQKLILRLIGLLVTSFVFNASALLNQGCYCFISFAEQSARRLSFLCGSASSSLVFPSDLCLRRYLFDIAFYTLSPSELLPMEFVPSPAVHRVLCADCGTPIVPNSANLCVACLRNTVDITEGIPKQASVSFCRNCERFLSPPTTWTIARPESQELLAICLKKLKGLNKIFEIEYLVQHGQCSDCTKLAAKNTWKALVQVRQKVPHKRTFLFLEQLILKHGAQKDTISIKERGAHPIKSFRAAPSSDTHSNTANFKYTYSVEIIPICKDDLVCIPLKLARQLSNISQLTVCVRVGNSVHLLDPATLHFCELTAPVYWRSAFDGLASVPDLVEFTVLDVEPSGVTRGKWVLADAQVALAGAFRAHNAGDDDAMDYESSGAEQIFHTRTHLGGILQPGDTALGYFLTHANFNSDDFAALPAHRVPDIVLVKKTYPNRRKKTKTRAWKLRSIAKEEGEEGETGSGRGVVGRMGGRDQKKVEEDYELFLQDLEEDEEMRGAVNLYKSKEHKPGAGSGLAGGKTRKKAQFAMDVDGEDQQQDDDAGAAPADTEEEEPDFPDVKLDELLEDFDEMTLGET